MDDWLREVKGDINLTASRLSGSSIRETNCNIRLTDDGPFSSTGGRWPSVSSLCASPKQDVTHARTDLVFVQLELHTWRS